MKILKYILPVALLCGAACEKDSVDATGEGSVRFDISCLQSSTTTRAAAPQQMTVRIRRSGDGGLVRRFDSAAEFAAPVYLLAGQYTIDVEAGDPTNTAFLYTNDDERMQKLCFKTITATPFTVTAHQETSVSVNVPTRNVGTTVCFNPDEADTENGNLSNVKIEVVAMNLSNPEDSNSQVFDAAAVGKPALTFDQLLASSTHEQSGYYLMPDGVTSLIYRFTATHNTAGKVEKIGAITTQAAAGYNYKTTFKYTKAPDGYFDLTIFVDERVEETFHDHFEFKPKPSIESGDFDIGEMQPYTEGSSVPFTCSSVVAINEIKLDNTTIYTKEGGVVTREAVASVVDGVTVDRISDKEVIVTLGPTWFAGKNNTDKALFNIDGEEYTYSFTKQMGLLEVSHSDYDLWLNTVKLRAIVADTPESVQFKFRRQGASEWVTVDAALSSGLTYAATIPAAWKTGTNTNETTYLPDPDKCVLANNTYEYELYVNGVKEGETYTFTTSTSQTIPYGDMEDSKLSCWGTENNTTLYWGSGNNSLSGGAGGLCAQDTFAGMEGSHCAHLKARDALGNLASGNLFMGTFTFGSPAFGDGKVGFGQSYNWQARPKSLKLKYYAKIGNVTNTDSGKGIKLAKGQPDEASIYVAIVNWNSRHNVVSGMNSCTGVWSPADGSNPLDSDGQQVGKIIGYGVFYPQGTTEGGSMIELEIPIEYYDQITRPSNAYTLVIGCSTSRYGDYMNGCASNELYLDDFRWGY